MGKEKDVTEEDDFPLDWKLTLPFIDDLLSGAVPIFAPMLWIWLMFHYQKLAFLSSYYIQLMD